MAGDLACRTLSRLVAEHHRPERNLLRDPPAEARRQGAVMIAGDPHHFDGIAEAGDRRPVGIVEPVGAGPVVEQSPSASNRSGRWRATAAVTAASVERVS